MLRWPRAGNRAEQPLLRRARPFALKGVWRQGVALMLTMLWAVPVPASGSCAELATAYAQAGDDMPLADMRELLRCVSRAYGTKRRASRAVSTPDTSDADKRATWQEAVGNTRGDAKLLRRAESGDVTAQFILGTMYADGTAVTQNMREAMRWLTLAASQGHEAAEKKLKKLVQYSIGSGTQSTSRSR